MENEQENKKIKAIIKERIDFYSALIDNTRLELSHIENVNDRICAIKSMVKLDCMLIKMRLKCHNKASRSCGCNSEENKTSPNVKNICGCNANNSSKSSCC